MVSYAAHCCPSSSGPNLDRAVGVPSSALEH